MENKYGNSRKKTSEKFGRSLTSQPRSRVLSLAQLLSRVRKQRGGGFFQQNSSKMQNAIASRDYNSQNSQFGKQGQTRVPSFSSGNTTKGLTRMEREEQKRQKQIKPMIPPKSLVIILKEKPEKILYNRRIIDYKHCGLLQRYIGLGGKILPRRQTRLTAKQQRYIAKTIKSARIMGLLPFVSKEKGFFR